MTYTAIVRWDVSDNRVNKYQSGFATQEAADAFIAGLGGAYPGAFSVLDPGGSPRSLIADSVAKIVSVSPVVVAPPTVIAYKAFQDRFTAAELDGVTKFIDAVDLVTGEPKRPRLKQAMGRAWSSNCVDLLDSRTVAFMDALVAGNIITEARKVEILVS